MKILDESRLLRDIELHVTDAEAARLIDSVADCRRDLAEVGMSESHWHVGDGQSQVTIYVYATVEELEAEVADRLSEGE